MKIKTRIQTKLKKVIKKYFNKTPIVELPVHCPVCRNDVSHFDRLSDYYLMEFDKYQYVHSIFRAETLNLFSYSCPICCASDRDRLYALYLEQRFANMIKMGDSYQFLDIAPAVHLKKFIKSFPFIKYRSMDLYMEDVDDKMDITNMDLYESNMFDIILCSHVLEHIQEDKKAISEIYRVLKPNGFAIIMVPIILELESDLENPKWTSVEDRWRYYGQDDHVRIYSKPGFVNKLNDAGFKLQQLGVDYFGADVFSKNGIHHRSVLYVVEK